MSLKRAVMVLDVEGAPKVKLTLAAIEVSGGEFAHIVATAAAAALSERLRPARDSRCGRMPRTRRSRA